MRRLPLTEVIVRPARTVTAKCMAVAWSLLGPWGHGLYRSQSREDRAFHRRCARGKGHPKNWFVLYRRYAHCQNVRALAPTNRPRELAIFDDRKKLRMLLELRASVGMFVGGNHQE